MLAHSFFKPPHLFLTYKFSHLSVSLFREYFIFFLTIMDFSPIVFLESSELMYFGKLLIGKYPVYIQPLHKLFLFHCFSNHSPVFYVCDCTVYK